MDRDKLKVMYHYHEQHGFRVIADEEVQRINDLIHVENVYDTLCDIPLLKCIIERAILRMQHCKCDILAFCEMFMCEMILSFMSIDSPNEFFNEICRMILDFHSAFQYEWFHRNELQRLKCLHFNLSLVISDVNISAGKQFHDDIIAHLKQVDKTHITCASEILEENIVMLELLKKRYRLELINTLNCEELFSNLQIGDSENPTS